MNRYLNKKILVTGGASGIGKAICERLITEGADLAFIDRNSEAGKEVEQELGKYEASIRFSLAKVETTPPEVTLHDMTGRLVGEATARGDEFVWDGRDESGQLLPPGAYLCRISVPADIGERAVHRIIILAY